MLSYASFNYPHRRFNPLKNEWLIVSPHRANRPWQGQCETPAQESIPPFDPTNPLCPTVKRSSGAVNPDYDRTFVFENDFPALLPHDRLQIGENNKAKISDSSPLFKTQSITGECRVMCFHKRSDLQLSTMSLDDVEAVIDCWQDQMRSLGSKYEWVQIFENKGAIMGCSNPHPHCQIWSGDYLPNEPLAKHENQLKYYISNKKPMLVDYLNQELERKERIVCENNHWLVVVPFWALEEKESLAKIMQQLLIKYDNMFKCSFPYSMAWQGAPTGRFLNENCDHWQLHAVYLPPLLRSASVKKFMAGFEMVCEPQRDITPEKAAAILRDLPNVHYKKTRTDNDD
uniref:Galactose-1-phosphate uridylyltransferase n=1 Tax=Romanomermis culicivorax TaxID=13658 RepID=A0A915KJX1_ROMCU